MPTRPRSILALGLAIGAAGLVAGPSEPWKALPPVRLAPPPPPAEPAPAATGLRLDDLQLIGSHNSYHLRPDVRLYRLVDGRASAWDYDHPPLSEQLDAGFRAFELDVFVDDEGGRFASPLVLRGGRTDPALESPGFKVLHVPDLDQRSNCPTLAGCLADIAAWSAAHPLHLPIVVMLECVAVSVGGRPYLDFAEAAAWTERHVAELDALVRRMFGDDGLVTPDLVRGRHASLADARGSDGWPALDRVRGRVMFVLTEDRGPAEMLRAAHPRLVGAAMFGQYGVDDPDASLVVINDPIGGAERIAAARGRGLLVRTRADADLVEPRRRDVARRDAALASGAHVISTDILAPRPGYAVRMPHGGTARVQPDARSPAAGAALEP